MMGHFLFSKCMEHECYGKIRMNAFKNKQGLYPTVQIPPSSYICLSLEADTTTALHHNKERPNMTKLWLAFE